VKREYLPYLALLGAGFGLGVLGLALGGPAPVVATLLLVAAAVVGVVGEVAVTLNEALSTSLENAQAGSTLRAGVRDALLIGVAASWSRTDPGALLVLAGGIGVVWLLRVVVEVLDHDLRLHRANLLTWRNLEVPGMRRSAPLAPDLVASRGVVQAVLLVVLSAVAAALTAGAGESVLVAGVAVAVGVSAIIAAVVVVDAVRVRRDTPRLTTSELVGAELARREAEVVFYYSRPEPVGYIANVWMPVLERLDRRIVVIAREQYNADLVETDLLPVVCVPDPTDLERVVPSCTRLAMYPSNVAKNNHLIRQPGIVDVFVGHGDSDKGGSATTLTRIYDEAWVSGPAARERYAVEQVGVRDDQIREIGRPQLAEIRRVVARTAPLDELAEPGVTTVLYAPTREGYFAAWQYSSVLAQGRAILESLLTMPRVHVLFKPHPGTGTDDPRFGAEADQLRELVLAAGEPHELVDSTEGLYAAFNRADVLVSDISSVITDFLASGKPYVVTDPDDRDIEEFRAAFPSARGAWILGGDGSGVVEAVEDARGPDRFAAERERTAAHLLGEVVADPVARFDAAIDEAVAEVHARLSAGRA